MSKFTAANQAMSKLESRLLAHETPTTDEFEAVMNTCLVVANDPTEDQDIHDAAELAVAMVMQGAKDAGYRVVFNTGSQTFQVWSVAVA